MFSPPAVLLQGPVSVAGTPITLDMLVVFALVLFALVLFATELLPIDVTAILVMVLLMVLGPFTHISPTEGISGFSSTATITVLAMLILSNGIRTTGAVQRLGRSLSAFAGESLHRQLAAVIGVAGPTSGFINNTPVVAILVPVVTDLAHEGKTSPSKLLVPLSFASMLGGMLTLIGTSTNILASAISERLLGHPFSMFEFTKLGLVVLVTGGLYLLVVAPWLLPDRVPPREDYIEEYEMEEYLTEVVVRADSPFVGETVDTAIDEAAFDADIIRITREGESFIEPFGRKEIQPGDTLTVRTDRDTLRELVTTEGLSLAGAPETEADLEPDAEPDQTLVEVVIPRGSFLVGETLASSTFRQRYDANVLAFRSRGELIRDRMDDIEIRVGDTLLVQASSDSIDRLAENRDFIVAHEVAEPHYRTEKIPHVVAILFGVVALPALDVLPILVTALAGVVAMVMTGVLGANELYDAVEWNVIFLLAGIIPLGIALEQTGGADLLGSLVAASADVLPLIGVLWVFYVATGLITSVISNNASVVLLIPVAVSAAAEVGANPFAFVLAVTFAASTAFLTPVGYQTNLFVYGPGGYRFTDFFRVGAPLQLLLSVVTTLGIAFFWGLRPA